jgi:hypothetical protein
MFTVRKANFFSAILAGQKARMPFGNSPRTCRISGQPTQTVTRTAILTIGIKSQANLLPV